MRLAYTIGGSGPPLVRAIDWLNHLDFEWKNPYRRHWFSQIMGHNTLLRYDQRGSGLSDWNVDDFSFERSLSDFEELIASVGFDKFALVGSCQGGPIGAAYAARHPERVTKLILVGAFARGWPPPGSMMTEQFNAMLTLIRLGWGRDNPAFRQLWTTLFRPDASPEESEWMNEFQRITSSPDNAALMMAEFPKIDITDLLPKVCCPTLVIHSRDEAVVPASEGRLIASRIRGARYVELPSRSHEVVPGEPAWQIFVDEFSRFLGWPDGHVAVQATHSSKLAGRLARPPPSSNHAALSASHFGRTIRNPLIDRLRIGDRLQSSARSLGSSRTYRSGSSHLTFPNSLPARTAGPQIPVITCKQVEATIAPPTM